MGDDRVYTGYGQAIKWIKDVVLMGQRSKELKQRQNIPLWF